jgi:hypothetical protein
MIETIFDLAVSRDFLVGIVLGAIALIALTITEKDDPSRPARPLLGITLGGGVLIGWLVVGRLHTGVALGTLLIGVGVGLAVRSGKRGLPVALAAIPGAAVMAFYGAVSGDAWVTGVLLVAPPIGGWLVARTAQLLEGRGILPALIGITALGLVGTLPEPKRALLLVGVALPLAFSAWPRRLASVGQVGAYLVAATLAAAIAVDNEARPAAMVGGLACYGVILIAPLIYQVTSTRMIGRGAVTLGWSDALVLVTHAACVVTMSRVAGLRGSPLRAGLIAVIVLGTLGVVAMIAPGAGSRAVPVAGPEQ